MNVRTDRGAISAPPNVVPRTLRTPISPGGLDDPFLFASGDITLPDGCQGESALSSLGGEGDDLPCTVGERPPSVWARYFHTTNAKMSRLVVLLALATVRTTT